MSVRDYVTIRTQKRTVLQNLGIEINEWLEKSLWLNSVSPHLQQVIKKESGYYTLSVEQMIEIAKSEEDAMIGVGNPDRYNGNGQRNFQQNFAMGNQPTPKQRPIAGATSLRE